MKAVLDTKPGSGYNDSAERYHFPSRYLNILRDCVGDWVVFRRTRASGGDLSYFAVGQIEQIAPDENNAGLHYAEICNYLSFDTPTPWNDQGRYAEGALREVQEPWQVGARLRGNSVRPLRESDFSEIVMRGLSGTFAEQNAIPLGLDDESIDQETRSLFEGMRVPDERRISQILTNRKIRDARFRGAVCSAYENRCAVTGLRIINGGGRAEVQAAHILPVKDGGPDIVQNGIALSATAHWLFDRHLISVNDDYRLLVSHNKVPSEFRNLFPEGNQQIHLPTEPEHWPAKRFLEIHREAFVEA